MNLYRITTNPEEGCANGAHFRKTLDAAHACAKQVKKWQVADTRVERIAIHPGADDIVAMLNGTYEFAGKVAPLQTWKLTPRLGLTECANGE